LTENKTVYATGSQLLDIAMATTMDRSRFLACDGGR